MRKIIGYSASLLIASAFFYSCSKSIDSHPGRDLNVEAINGKSKNKGVNPYQFERVNQNNFYSQGWKEQQVNIVSGVTGFSDLSDHVEIVPGPENLSDTRLIPGSVKMNLPTGDDPTLRRIRLRRGGYSGTPLAHLVELKYSTYVVQNAPVIMVLQVDVTSDESKDFNIFFEPRDNKELHPFELNKWQQWNALEGLWHVEVSTIPIPEPLAKACTIKQITDVFSDARIIDTPPVGHNGEGVRFTIGGTPRSLFDNTICYFDALIIGTRNEQRSTLFDFTSN